MGYKKAKTFISLFSGAGGLDFGLLTSGFSNRLCVEIDPVAQETLKANHPKWRRATPGDIHLLSPAEILKQAQISPKDLTLLAAGPPCQPFSKSGYWVSGDTNRLNDPRATTLKAYLALVEIALPEVLIIENVKGISYAGKKEAIDLLLYELKKINKAKKVKYTPHIITMNALDYGVPQSRERVFIIAHREGKPFVIPSPTHFAPSATKIQKNQYTTAWDAIGDLDVQDWPPDLEPSGKWADLLPTIPEGLNYQWHTDKAKGLPLFGYRTRYWSFLLKLAKNQPSWTIQAQPGPATGPFHWKGRLLSVQELARLQTFPDSYRFPDDRREAYKQIGNAVPPAIGELLGLEIRRQFFGEQVRRKLRLIPEKRNDCPPPETPKEVPEKYLNLIGNHVAHPGVGKGPGAQKRGNKGQVYA